MTVPKALTIAGSDSGGGAGIQADLKTFSAFEVFGMSAVTAVTAQSSLGVLGVLDLPPEFVGRQIDAVLDDLGADAIKTGMLATKDIVGTVAGRRIGALGPRHVLVKGGHLKDAATDVLWDGRTLTRFPAPRVEGPATHGTGCTYSAAIAAGLAHGRALIEAITEAKAYVTAAIRGAIQVGRGAAALRHVPQSRAR